MFGLSSDAAITTETMLTKLNNPTFHTEATSVALVEPCRRSFDEKRQSGCVLALAGRYAR